ncbi:hypothetical protein ACCO45_006175 [Purpureocillium lilacinum]|uniref:Uncharacterized protein n=1 Tax=Purpureocillium lilacinum TaxID=33203 RepID=A0ACC4E0J5_PURLI
MEQSLSTPFGIHFFDSFRALPKTLNNLWSPSSITSGSPLIAKAGEGTSRANSSIRPGLSGPVLLCLLFLLRLEPVARL